MKNTIKITAILLLFALFISGCNNANSSSTSSPEVTATPLQTEKPVKAKIALVLSLGSRGNSSYNDVVYEGAQRAVVNLNVKVDTFEPTKVEDYSTIISQLSKDGTYDLIIAASPDAETAVRKYAKQYPNQKFTIIDASIGNLANVKSVTKSYCEMTFLAGLLAGYITKNNVFATNAVDTTLDTGKDTVGIVIGTDTILTRQALAGFTAGVKLANPKATVKVVYVGSWVDKLKSQELASTLYKSGVDIIMCFAGEASTGVIEAAVQNNKYVIGVSDNQNSIAPNNVIASCTEATDIRVYSEIEQIVGDFWVSGINSGGLKEGATDLTYDNSKVAIPKEIKEQVMDYKRQVVNDYFNVPSDSSKIDLWLSTLK